MLHIAEMSQNKAWGLFYGDPRAHAFDKQILALGGRYLWPNEEALLESLDIAGMAAVEDAIAGYTYVVPL